MFDIFTILFAILILVGMVLLLRRRASLGDHSKASMGLSLGLALGGAVGLVLSRIVIHPSSIAWSRNGDWFRCGMGR